MPTSELSAPPGHSARAVPSPPGVEVPDLAFSKKYQQGHALEYFWKHERGFSRRFSTMLERHMARRALACASDPRTVLDLPCGTGRFWPVLAEQADRVIHAADLNQSMINVGRQLRPPELVARVQTFEASAFAVPRPDDFVECVFSMRLMHHIEEPEHRVQMLREFARLASQTVLVSLWVDGNYQAWRRRVRDQRLPQPAPQRYRNRMVIARSVFEREVAEAGLRILDRVDFLPFYSMWSTYVLAVK